MALSALVPSRLAGANAATTGESLSCVVRNYAPLPPQFALPSPELVDLAAEQYRAAIVQPQKTESFLFWAAETADFAPSRGNTLNMFFRADPTTVLLADAQNRQVQGLLSVQVRRGDTGEVVELVGQGVFAQGIFRITGPSALSSLDGGLFEARGDQLIASSYVLASASFWWTKNDEILNRYAWDGRLGRWRPIRGGSARPMGPLGDDLELGPMPSWIREGDFLPGDSSEESYAFLRLHSSSGQAIAEPAVDGFGGVLVVADVDEFSFQGTTLAGVVNLAGELRWNPDFVASRSGTPIWYSTPNLEDTGTVGLFGEPLTLAPVPGPLEYPFLRIGSRRWLSVVFAANDTALSQLDLNASQVGLSETTGRLRFAPQDLARLDPSSEQYDPNFLGEQVFYDGLAYGRKPAPLRASTVLVDKNGVPSPVGTELYLSRGDEISPGVSGLLWVPDGTGVPPISGPIGARPLGSGLRQEISGPWGLSLYGDRGTITDCRVVDTSEEVPRFAFQIPEGTAFLVRNTGRVFLSREDEKKFSGDLLFFRQNLVTPSVALPDARLWSRQRYQVSLAGSEQLIFQINNASFVWNAPEGEFSAEEIASSIQTLVGGLGDIQAIRGHIVIAPPKTNGGYFGDVEISVLSTGWPLGFLPGWKTSEYVSDHGASLGLHETVDASAPDINAMVRVEDLVLAEQVPASPFVLLQQVPLQDEPGYAEQVFFRLQQGVTRRLLQPFQDVLYEFERNRFSWHQQTQEVQVLTQPTTTLALNGLVTQRLLEAPGNGLSISSPGEGFIPQVYGGDYRLTTDPGTTLLLIREVGRLVLTSDTGEVVQTTLQDSSQDFEAVQIGMQIQTGSEVRTITSVTPGLLGVNLPFGDPGRTSYSIFEASPEGTLLASQYEVFSPLPEEPFRVRLLSPLGPLDGALEASGYVPSRSMSLRFGLENSSATATLAFLARREIGVLGTSLSLTPDNHTAVQAYHLELDGEVYSFSLGNLVLVQNPGNPTGDIIEVVSGTLELVVGAATLVAHPKTQAIYVQDFLNPGSMLFGQAEMDLTTGQIQVSAEDLFVHGHNPVYLVQVLRTGQDVTLNPIQGSLLLTAPLLPMQIVEAEYFQAEPGTGNLRLVNGVPVRVVEFLSLRILNEKATATSDLNRWSFDPTKRTIDAQNPISVRVGPVQCNIGDSLKASVRPETQTIVFALEQDANAEVLITYSVLEAFGGEQSFSVTSAPVWRPPFRLNANTDHFTLLGDRTGDVIPGKLLRVGGSAFYILSSSYDGTETEVVFSPPTTVDVGSANPGSDSISALTDLPIRDRPELWKTVGAEYAPVSRGSLSLQFQEKLDWIVVGAILEIGGQTYIVADVEVDEVTTVGLTTFIARGFVFGEDAVRITIRPIYPPWPQDIFGPGLLDPEAPTTVIQVPLGDVGTVLTPNLDYTIDSGTGNLRLRRPVPPRTEIQLRYTLLRSLAPESQDGITLYPRASLRYAAITTPPAEVQASSLLATYTFANPDSFVYRVMPLDEFVGEVAASLAASTGLTGGPFLGGQIGLPPSQEGTQGPRGEVETLKARDRAARRLIEIYQNAILPFEQVLETMDGQVIGDRSGKFRFFIGRSEAIAPPGYEDPVSGDLVPFVAFARIFSSYRPDIYLLTADPIVEPLGAQLDGETLEGPFPDPELLSAWISIQRNLIRNDIDDVVLIGRTRKKLRTQPLRVEAFGRYKRMGEAHVLSRIYPENSGTFTQMDPGLGADLEATPPNPGVYAFRKRIDRPSFENGVLSLPKRQSTWQTAIAQIENPVFGQIENIAALSLVPRLPRGRIVRYSEFGFPELDAFVINAGGIPFSSVPRPAMIVSVVPLGEFPLDAQGNPDFQLLAFSSGPVPDLSTGDPDLFTPPWFGLVVDQALPKVSLGRPNGSLLDLATFGSDNYTFGNQAFSKPRSVFVGEVLLGCIVTFASADGGIAKSLFELEGETLAPATISPGDSLLVVAPDAKVLNDVDDPVTQTQRDLLVQGIPGFRIGFDVGLEEGELRDTTLPSFFDPSLFGLKEILGQRPPLPLMMVEGRVRFRNTRLEPLEIPALRGEARDDSGDIQVPYLNTESEAQILGLAQKAMDNIVDPDSPAQTAVFPDEVLGTDGRILTEIQGETPPSTLLTEQNFLPVSTAGVYVPHSGVGDIEEFDLLLVEVGQAGVPSGAQGFLGVGRTEAHGIEPPRFVSPTSVGDRIRYRFNSMMSFVNQPPMLAPPGLVIRRVGLNTQFDLTTLSNGLLVWNDGGVLAAGGLNIIFNPGGAFAYPNNENTVRFHLWTAARPGQPAQFLQTIDVAVGNGNPTVTGDVGTEVLLLQPSANVDILEFQTAGPFVTISPVPNPGEIPEDPNIPGQSVPLWFTVDVDTSANGNAAGNSASLTAAISQDRLTFEEDMDLRSVLPRDEPNVDGLQVFSTLEVFFVTGETSDAVTVNGPAEVNAGQPFTFGARSLLYPKVGSFDVDVLGVGQVRVMAWEGHGNLPVASTSDLTFTAIPSSESDSEGIICFGNAQASATQNYRLTSVTPNTGDLTKVVAGDIVQIKSSSSGRATTKAGTYLVRHVVVPNVGITLRDLTLVTETLPPNTGKGFAPIRFPVVTINGANITSSFTLDVIPEVQGISAFPPTGTLYFVRVLDTTSGEFLSENYAVDYIAVDTILNTFTVDLLTARDFAGNVIPAATLDNVQIGTLVTGFDRVEVRMEASTEEHLPRSLVSLGNGVSTAMGFAGITLESPSASIAYIFGGIPDLVVGPPAPLEVGIDAAIPVNNTAFQTDPNAVVYENVPGVIYLGEADWATLHAPALVSAILPGDRLVANFFAEAGIFLEPSFPRPVLSYTGANYRVVDAQSSVAPSEIGFRDATAFGEIDPEPVSFGVGRIRRFHEVLTHAGEALAPLTKLYKMARAVGVSYGTQPVGLAGAPNPFVLDLNFQEYIPNIQPGDLIRVMEGHQVLASARVEGVQTIGRIWLEAPGLAVSPVGRELQIWLRQAPVPHEQSWEELLELMTEQVVLDRSADYTAQTGGVVETEENPTDPRHLRDTDKTLDYIQAGVAENDLLIIDPAGPLRGPTGLPNTGKEFGSRPFGDRSVPSRTTPTQLGVIPFIAGSPSELDDNRGFYRIGHVTADGLQVQATTTFSDGITAPPVIFGQAYPYAVLPTVSGSEAPFASPPGGPGTEGQMDLRPTAFAGTLGSPPNSFKGNLFSIGPFAYRVIRPSSIFSEETQELILLMRERTLSMIEAFEAFLRGGKYGTYFVFQRDLQGRDLGSPTIPSEGRGVMSNAFVDSIRGLTSISPFANTSDALSILDRRFWIGDTRLDRESPAFQPNSPSYATLESNAANPSSPVGEGRPVLPDRIGEALNTRDQLRASRLCWIQARTQREIGTLAQVDQALSQLNKRLAELRSQILRRRSLNE